MNDPILERRQKPVMTAKKTIRTKFHTFTLDDAKVLTGPQKIQDFDPWRWLRIWLNDKNTWYYRSSPLYSLEFSVISGTRLGSSIRIIIWCLNTLPLILESYKWSSVEILVTYRRICMITLRDKVPIIHQIWLKYPLLKDGNDLLRSG